MNLPAFKSYCARTGISIFALTIFAGNMQAVNVLLSTVPPATTSPAVITLTCSTVNGPGAAVTVNVKPVTPGTTLAPLSATPVTVGSLAGTGLVVTFAPPPSPS